MITQDTIMRYPDVFPVIDHTKEKKLISLLETCNRRLENCSSENGHRSHILEEQKYIIDRLVAYYISQAFLIVSGFPISGKKWGCALCASLDTISNSAITYNPHQKMSFKMFSSRAMKQTVIHSLLSCSNRLCDTAPTLDFILQIEQVTTRIRHETGKFPIIRDIIPLLDFDINDSYSEIIHKLKRDLDKSNFLFLITSFYENHKLKFIKPVRDIIADHLLSESMKICNVILEYLGITDDIIPPIEELGEKYILSKEEILRAKKHLTEQIIEDIHKNIELK